VDRRGTTRGIGRRFPGDPSQYADSYRLEVIGDARMTGRLAKVVAIVPNDTLRYGYRLYLDLETGLPLKSDVMGEDGNPVEQLMFTSLRVADDIDPVQLEPVLQGRLYTLVHKSTAAKPASSGETRWRIGKLPPGFELTAADRRQAEQGKGELEHFVFSDGIASVSIYVERADPETAFRGAYRMGAIHAFARELEGHQITAVGEVPAETVRMMAESVTRTGGGSP
jgi:sigma-E factor negative regulatory protein RseB